MNDDPVETVVYQRQQAAKQRAEGVHRFSSSKARLNNEIIGQGPVDIQSAGLP